MKLIRVLQHLKQQMLHRNKASFLYYNEAVKINYDKFDHTNAGGTYYATRLTGGSTNEKFGLTKTLSVMPGDKISMEVYAKYLDPNSSNWTTAQSNFVASIVGGTAPAGTFVDGGAAGSIGGGTYPISGINHSGETGTAPKAYLNYIVFNKDMTTVLDMGFKRITTNSREYGQDAAHDKLAFEGSEEVLIKEPGYVYIYLSNENETPVEVFGACPDEGRDDFKVEHKKSPVVQMDDYYPFGLSFNSYQRENSTANQYKYNGKEQQTELNLGWLDFGMRMYQPELGRFFTQDRFAEKYLDFTPYHYGANNPVLFVDINGDSLAVKEIDAGSIDKFKQNVQNGSGGYWTAEVDASTGLVTLVENKDIEGQMNKDQAAFVKELSRVTTGDGVATINLVNNSESVVIGKIATNTVDVGDMQKLGTDGKITAQKALVHEVNENYDVQVNSLPPNIAHQRAGNSENRIGGAILSPLDRPTTPTNHPNLTTLTIPVIGPPEQRGVISIHLYKNNVLNVSGNSTKSLLPPLKK
jgi:RHS repeat-associated protein